MAIPPPFDRRLTLAAAGGASGATDTAIFVLPYLVSLLQLSLDHPPDNAVLASATALSNAVLTSDFPRNTDWIALFCASLIFDSCGPKVHAVAKVALSKRFLTSGFEGIAGSVPRSLRDGSANP